MTVLLEVRDLVKEYREVRAVDGIGLQIRQGECFGLLGPNGAGKTTTIEILEGVTEPTRGRVLYRGVARGSQYRNEVGIMFQATALQEHQTVRETLRLFARLYPRTAVIEELVEQCALHEFLDRDVKKLSGGQRQRLLLAIALVNDPEIVFLDEPTTGLDPQARRRFWSLIRTIREQGKTIVLTTHYMDEAYMLSDEIAIMDHGRIIARGDPRTLLAEHTSEVILQLPRTVLASTDHDLGFSIQHRGEQAEILTHDVDAALATLLAAGVPLAQLRIRSATLEDLFIELTGRELRA